jgi:methyl-accepting chemotaxis protein
MTKNYQRKTYYIKNSAQSKFIFRFVTASIFGGILAICTFNYLAYKKIDTVLYSMRMPKISPGGLLWNEMIYTNIFVFIFILLVFILTARSLYNRIHGPLKKLTNDIKRMESGDFSRDIALRQKDEFQDFAQTLNQMSHELNSRFYTIENAADKIITAAEQIPNSQDQQKQLDEISKETAQIAQTLQTFKI